MDQDLFSASRASVSPQRWASWPWSFGILNTLSSWREILQRNTEPLPCLSYARIWPCYY